jgi:hypothetical protein
VIADSWRADSLRIDCSPKGEFVKDFLQSFSGLRVDFIKKFQSQTKRKTNNHKGFQAIGRRSDGHHL